MTAPRPAIYLDHNASTPVDERVLARFLEVERDCPGNPHSLHAEGRRAGSVVEDARAVVAEALGGLPVDDVLFASGGTEANNTAIAGLGDAALPVLLAPVEHPSVWDAAGARRGRVEWAVDPGGVARVEAPAVPVGLVCLAHAQNELGALQPVAAAADVARELAVPLLVDASQSLGRVDVGDAIARASCVVFSAHKCGGLRGATVFVARDAARELAPLLHGGGQERGVRPGTPSPALVAATATAVQLAVRERETRSERMRAALEAFSGPLSETPGVERLTPSAALPNTLMLRFHDVDGRSLLPALDLAGVCASQGSACSSGSPQPPRVLRAIGLDDAGARQCVRFSFAATTSTVDAHDAACRTRDVVERLRVVASS